MKNMSGLFESVPLLLAQDAGGGSFLTMLPFLLPMLFFFYFLIIMPQQQQEKKRRAMLEKLKKNDKVLTTGGLYATVISVDGSHDRVVLRVDDERNVKMTFTMSSVARVLEASSEKASEST
jgi:preprotein translocase subunit YajC